MERNPISTSLRALTAPVRGFVDRRVDAVTGEVRQQAGERRDEIVDAITRIDQAHTALVADLTARVDELTARVDDMSQMLLELRATNDQLLAVVAASTERPDPAAG